MSVSLTYESSRMNARLVVLEDMMAYVCICMVGTLFNEIADLLSKGCNRQAQAVARKELGVSLLRFHRR